MSQRRECRHCGAKTMSVTKTGDVEIERRDSPGKPYRISLGTILRHALKTEEGRARVEKIMAEKTTESR